MCELRTVISCEQEYDSEKGVEMDDRFAKVLFD